ncbi:MAG: hypothetical protein PWP46_1488 [Fusobacteriaceae bacterium]|nr:hypothetical protein [Fusobacteriaceae bacterium]
MDKYWEILVKEIDFAYQPIIDINTKKIYGYEALLRNYKNIGFNTINEFFDTAYLDSTLYKVDLLLREKAIKKFKTFTTNEKLFYNIDNRLLEMPDYSSGNTLNLLNRLNFEKKRFCIEVSERHNFSNILNINKILEIYKSQGFDIAIDDFGSGFSNLHKLYFIEPQIIKIDRFFISDINKDKKKRLFMKNIVSLAHSLNSIIIAEGIETREEYDICKEIKCDYAQGFYIKKPSQEINNINILNI